MSFRRYQVFAQSRAPEFPQGQSVPVPRPSGAALTAEENKRRVESMVDSRRVLHGGTDSSLIQYGVLNPITFPAIGLPQPVITFVVPVGRVLVVDRVEWWCSEPYLYGNGQFGWRMSVDGKQIPYWGAQFDDAFGLPTNRRPDYFLIPLAPTLGNEPKFSPIFVQTGQSCVVELVEISPGLTSFTGQAWAAAYVYGQLRKPAGEGL